MHSTGVVLYEITQERSFLPLDRLANMNQNPIAKKRLQIFPKAKMT